MLHSGDVLLIKLALQVLRTDASLAQLIPSTEVLGEAALNLQSILTSAPAHDTTTSLKPQEEDVNKGKEKKEG
ncbi:hypothetical protein Ccrd_019295 [Cynara cardunculus var. scolymus]|uniref:Uncharacterized protein n=1 Tax=Cynara cardunculus var. scolymus TaxID=59895 RepID=A0A103Y4L7_CYNCS|nr:hypothetical protein Ccrd_019295 [Cynara cardunculus var. scolymus]